MVGSHCCAKADLRASETRLKSVEVENMQLKEGCVRLQAALKTSNEQLQDATQRLRVVTQVSIARSDAYT